MPTNTRPSTYEIREWRAGPADHVVVASGEIDLHVAPSLRDTLRSLAAQGPRHLVLDMTAATFLDSAAIGVLIGHLRTMKTAGGALTVACANENVLRILEISGVARALTIRSTVEEALGWSPASPDEEEEPGAWPVARKLELHVAPKPSELARVRGFADAAALRFGLDPRERYDFTVAANEAVANAIRHGQPCDDDTIHVWVTEQEGALTLGVQDAGVFAPDPVPTDPLPESGRGLMLMSQLVDAVALTRTDGHTNVQLSMQRT
jgi:anti-sigma B factor antagonist